LLVFALHFFHHHVASAAQIDYLALALGAFASWAGVPGPGEPLLIAAAIVAAGSSAGGSGWSRGGP